MNTIRALKPGLNVLRFCGYSPYRITEDDQLEFSDSFRNYSLLLLLLFGSLTVYSFFFELEDSLESTVRYILIVLVYFVVFFALLESAWKTADQLEMLQNFNQVDQILETKFSHNIQTDLRRHVTRTISAYCIVLLLILVADLAILLVTSSPASGIRYLAFYFIAYVWSSLRYLQIIYFTWMIKKRLNFLNKTLDKMVKEKNSAVPTISFDTMSTIQFLNKDLGKNKNRIVPLLVTKNSYPPELNHLNVLRDVYFKLWLNSQLFNKAFGLSLLVNLGFDFLSLTTDIYWLIVSFSTVVDNVSPTPTLYGDFCFVFRC